jgi:hypothetical protein
LGCVEIGITKQGEDLNASYYWSGLAFSSVRSTFNFVYLGGIFQGKQNETIVTYGSLASPSLRGWPKAGGGVDG